jgi:hypothetical protein
VDDDRIPRGSLLGFEDTGHSGGVESIGSESVNRFGGQGNQSACAQNLSSLSYRRLRLVSVEMRWIHREPERLHPAIFAGLKRLAPLRILAAYHGY